MLDPQGRPYFLWDEDMTLETFRERLGDPDPEVRAYFLGKLMRQAKPDDVFTFTTVEQIESQSPELDRYLGTSREFWHWLLAQWRAIRHGDR